MTSAASIAPLSSFEAHDDPINHLAFACEGRLIASADTGMKVKVWRDRELSRTYDLKSVGDKSQPSERIRGVRLTANGERLFVAAGENLASYRLDSESDEPDWVYVAPRLFVFFVVPPIALTMSANDTLAAAFDNGSLAIWNANGTRRNLIRHNSAPRFVEFITDDRLIGAEGHSMSEWHADQREPIWLRKTRERIYGMAVTSDGKYLALRRLFTTTIYNIADGSQLVEYKQGRGLPLVAFAPGTHTLAAGTQHAITLHDVTGEDHTSLALDDAELVSLIFLPDGSQVVAGCSDGRIRIWENPLHQALESGAP